MSKLLRRDTKKEDNSYHISQISGGGLVGEPATDNLKIGTGALGSLTTGDYNIAIGKDAGNSITTALYNVCIGYQAGKGLTTTADDDYNVLIGYQAGLNCTGKWNTIIGPLAGGLGSFTGDFNTAIGPQALYDIQGGDFNVALGQVAGADITSGGHNFLLGRSAGRKITTSSYNVAISSSALATCVTGANNIAIGYEAGYTTKGSNNVYIGYQAGREHDGSDELFIDNTNTATPLIHGDFSANVVTINGQLKGVGEVITPSKMYGSLGFVDGDYFGAALLVAFSDVNARVWASFYVRNGGSFKVSIIHSGNGANNGKEASGVLYVSYDVADGAGAWDVNGVNFDLTIDNAGIVKMEEYGTPITIADDSHVGMFWGKDDNAAAAANNMYVYSIILKRQ